MLLKGRQNHSDELLQKASFTQYYIHFTNTFLYGWSNRPTQCSFVDCHFESYFCFAYLILTIQLHYAVYLFISWLDFLVYHAQCLYIHQCYFATIVSLVMQIGLVSIMLWKSLCSLHSYLEALTSSIKDLEVRPLWNNYL